MVNESTPFGRQAARKRYSAAATGVKGLRRLPALGLLSLAIALAQAAPVHAQNVGETRDYTISSQPLSTALNQLALAADRQIMVPPELVRGRTAPALAGHYSLDAALKHLLAGSGLTYEITSTGTVMVKQAPPDPPHRQTKPVPAASQKADEKPEPTTLQTVTVTGTHIRGGTTASPMITIGQENMKEEGFANLGDVIRSIPQNFSGGQNPGVTIGSGANLQNSNKTSGSAFNLRGLGTDATLTLLNGQRLTYSGVVQAVDVSAIPIAAIDRLEVMTDGASAIYGSDAVAGVANVILKKDYDGVDVAARFGGATDGGMGTRQYDLTAGTTWATGGFIFTYDDQRADAIFTDQRDYASYMLGPRTLYPEISQHSALLSGHQQLGDNAVLSIDVLHNQRNSQTIATAPTVGLIYKPGSEATFVSPRLEFKLAGDWMASLAGTYGKERSVYGSISSTRAGVVLSSSKTCYCNTSKSVDVGAEGSVFTLPGGDARASIGAGQRSNDYVERTNSSTNAETDSNSSHFVYGEINLPFVSPQQEISGINRFSLMAAVRHENYRDIGSVTTPKIGLIYQPTADLGFKTTWGRSFKAPTLLQLHQPIYAFLYPASLFGADGVPADANVLFMTGGSMGSLEPERARTLTASVEFHPESISGLEAELSYFDIDFTNRVVTPVNNIYTSLRDPGSADFVDRNPSAEQQAGAIAAANNGLSNYTTGNYDPAKVIAIINTNYINAATQRTKGFDFSGSYGFNFAQGKMTFRGSASWLTGNRQNSRGQPEIDTVGMIYNPPKWHARAGAVWQRGGLTLSSFVSRVGGVINNNNFDAPYEMGAFTTVDTTVSYSTDTGNGVLSDMEFSLSAQNMFNKAPPTYPVPDYNYGNYDSTNYSAVGRFVSLSIAKHW